MRALLLLSPVLACCAEPDLVRILDGRGRGWDLVDTPRGALVDLDHVSGPTARFWARSVLADDALTPALDADKAGDVLVGELPHARWTMIGGTAVPDDYDSLALFTAFAHTERALEHFRAAGVTGRAVTPVDVHYLPDLGHAGLAQTDNAYYFVPADAILLLRPEHLQDVPLAMNPGVLAHELAHRVAYWQMWEGHRLEVYAHHETGSWTLPQIESMYLIASLDEGLADYFGAVISDDPAFVGASVGTLQESRDVSVPRTYDADWIGTTDTFWTDGAYDPYRLGSVVASALWAAGEELGHDRVSEAVVDAQLTLAADTQSLDLLHTELEIEVVRALGPEACGPFSATYAEVWDAFAEVCP